jgi:hypothetical protein
MPAFFLGDPFHNCSKKNAGLFEQPGMPDKKFVNYIPPATPTAAEVLMTM